MSRANTICKHSTRVKTYNLFISLTFARRRAQLTLAAIVLHYEFALANPAQPRTTAVGHRRPNRKLGLIVNCERWSELDAEQELGENAE